MYISACIKNSNQHVVHSYYTFSASWLYPTCIIHLRTPVTWQMLLVLLHDLQVCLCIYLAESVSMFVLRPCELWRRCWLCMESPNMAWAVTRLRPAPYILLSKPPRSAANKTQQTNSTIPQWHMKCISEQSHFGFGSRDDVYILSAAVCNVGISRNIWQLVTGKQSVSGTKQAKSYT